MLRHVDTTLSGLLQLNSYVLSPTPECKTLPEYLIYSDSYIIYVES